MYLYILYNCILYISVLYKQIVLLIFDLIDGVMDQVCISVLQ